MSGNGTSNETSNSCVEFETEALCHAVNGVGNTIGFIASISCIFVIGRILFTKKYKFPSHRVILYTTVALLFQSIQFMWSHISFVNDGKYHRFCVFQGFYAQLSSAVVLGWMCVTTFNVVWIGVLIKTPGWRLEIFEFVIAIVPATLFSLIPFTLQLYGPSGLWCWITASESGKTIKAGIALQFIMFYIPYFIGNMVAAFVLVFSVCVIQGRLRRSRGCGGASHEYQEKLWKDDVRPLFWLPWLIIVVWLVPLINRIRLALDVGRDNTSVNFFFWFFHAFSRPFAGILFALIIAVDMVRSSKKKKMEDLSVSVHPADTATPSDPLGLEDTQQ